VTDEIEKVEESKIGGELAKVVREETKKQLAGLRRQTLAMLSAQSSDEGVFGSSGDDRRNAIMRQLHSEHNMGDLPIEERRSLFWMACAGHDMEIDSFVDPQDASPPPSMLKRLIELNDMPLVRECAAIMLADDLVGVSLDSCDERLSEKREGKSWESQEFELCVGGKSVTRWIEVWVDGECTNVQDHGILPAAEAALSGFGLKRPS